MLITTSRLSKHGRSSQGIVKRTRDMNVYACRLPRISNNSNTSRLEARIISEKVPQ